MKLMMLKNVAGIGKVGDIVDVSDAHARNFLIPGQMAVAATKEIVAKLEREQNNNRIKSEHRALEMSELLTKLENSNITIKGKASPHGKLFAAIKSKDIQQVIEKQYHVKLDGLKCVPDHLKNLGANEVKIIIDDKYSATINVLVEHGD